MECVDGDGDSVQPSSLSSWRGRGEGVFENVQRAQRGLTLGSQLSRK